VKLMTREPVAGKRHFEGRLDGFQDGRLTLDVSRAKKKQQPDSPQKVEIELANVEKANLVSEI
jgi:ribosome maturation factor RimP